MSAAYSNLFIDQGATFSTTITIDDAYGNLYNLASYSVSSQIRQSYYSANATASFSTSINNDTGSVTLYLDASVTANIAPGRYVYDALLIDNSNNTRERIVEGIAEVSPSVTR